MTKPPRIYKLENKISGLDDESLDLDKTVLIEFTQHELILMKNLIDKDNSLNQQMVKFIAEKSVNAAHTADQMGQVGKDIANKITLGILKANVGLV